MRGDVARAPISAPLSRYLIQTMASPTLNTPFQPYVYQSPHARTTPFQILGGDAQMVQIILKPGEWVRAEPGSLCYMSGNMVTETHAEREGVWRWLAGESFFINTFLNQGPGSAYIGLAAPTLSKVLPIDLTEHGGELVCQRDAFLCSLSDVTVTAEMTRRAGVGIFVMDGLFYQKLTGHGLAFICAGGAVVQKPLSPGESLVVESACLLAASKSVECQVRYVGSLQRAVFGGAGLCHLHLTGPGVVFLHSMPFHRLARRVENAIANPRLRDTPAVCLRVALSVFVLSFLLGALALVYREISPNANFRFNFP